MKFVDILASYLPSLIVHHLAEHDTTSKPPTRQNYSTVCMFADVSGFTALSEAMGKYGPEGAEYLAKHLNSYFSQMVKLIASEGGDIFKFAGDAMIILWPDVDALELRARRAAQCALAVQESLHKAALAEGVTLSVKIGIGVGKVSVLHLGGVLNRMEYVAVGEPLVQAFGAEHHAEAGGEVIVSPEAWSMIENYFNPLNILDSGAVRLTRDGIGISPEDSNQEGPIKQKLTRMGKVYMMKKMGLDDLETHGPELEKLLRSYVPGAILPWISPDCPDLESWGGDLRNVCVLFVNLGLKEHDLLAAAQYDDAMHRSHQVLVAVQRSVYQYEGSVNKFLMDDKGSTLIAVFGLPPLSHEDDSTRGVLCGLAICDRLWELGLTASIGITTGVVFCGVAGSTTRKEYSVLGDTVNLSARLMQRACQTGGGVLVDEEIMRGSQNGLSFNKLDAIYVKGKSMPINIYEPICKISDGLEPQFVETNYHNNYVRQLNNYHMYSKLHLHYVDPPPPRSDPGEVIARAEEKKVTALNSPTPGTKTPRLKKNETPTLPFSEPLQLSLVPRSAPAPLSKTITDNLLMKPPAKYTFTTIPEVSFLTVKVPSGLDNDDWMTRQISYKSLLKLSGNLEVSTEDQTLNGLVKHAVDSAKEDNLLHKDADDKEFLLLFEGGQGLLPRLDLDPRWLSIFITELQDIMNFPDLAKGIKPWPFILVRARDAAIVQSRHYAAKQALLVSRLSLYALGQGSCIVLEGPSGSGKTFLLRDFTKMMTGKTSIICSNGSPFTRTERYAVWGQVLKQYLDKLVEERGGSRTEIVRSLLENHSPDPRLSSMFFLVNDLVDTEIPKDTNVMELTTTIRKEATKTLIMTLVRSMAIDHPVVLVIDDAFYMHSDSWDVALELAAACNAPKEQKGALAVSLIISTRPITQYLDAITPHAPSSYHAMMEAPFVNYIKISRLPRSDSQSLVAACCQWHGGISKQLLDLVEGKAQGNPLMIQEVVINLINKQRIVVEPDDEDDEDRVDVERNTQLVPFPLFGEKKGRKRRTSTMNSMKRTHSTGEERRDLFNKDKEFGKGGVLKLIHGLRTLVPFCRATHKNLGMQVDRLEPHEQLLLKVGSIIAHHNMQTLKKTLRDRFESSDGERTPQGRSDTVLSDNSHDSRLSPRKNDLSQFFQQVFKFSVLYDSFPMESLRPLLPELLQKLENKGYVIRSLVEPTIGSETSIEPQYEFTHSFVSDTVRLRVLAEQRKNLDKSIEESLMKEKEAVTRAKLDQMQKRSSQTAFQAGWVNVRKNVDASKNFFGKKIWKSRWVEMDTDELKMFKEEKGKQKGQEPVQTIPLEGASVKKVQDGEFSVSNVLQLDCPHWYKKGGKMDESRCFFFSAETPEQAEEWYLVLRYFLKKQRKKATSIMDDTKSEAGSKVASELIQNESGISGLDFAGNRLAVYLDRAEDLVSAKSNGYASPFVAIDLDGSCQYSIVKTLDIEPRWDQHFVFPVRANQIENSHIRFTVWDKDKYGANMLLGLTKIPLADLDIVRQDTQGSPKKRSDSFTSASFDGEEAADVGNATASAALTGTDAKLHTLTLHSPRSWAYYHDHGGASVPNIWAHQPDRNEYIYRGHIHVRLQLILPPKAYDEVMKKLQNKNDHKANESDLQDSSSSVLAVQALRSVTRGTLEFLDTMDKSGIDSDDDESIEDSENVDLIMRGDEVEQFKQKLRKLDNQLSRKFEADEAVSETELRSYRTVIQDTLQMLNDIISDRYNRELPSNAKQESPEVDRQELSRMVSLLNVDEANKDWLLQQFCKPEQSYTPTSQKSLTDQRNDAGALRRASLGPSSNLSGRLNRHTRRSSSFSVPKLLPPPTSGQNGEDTAEPSPSGRRRSRLSVGQISLRSLQSVPEMDDAASDNSEALTSWSDNDEVIPMDPPQIHEERCRSIPGYLPVGRFTARDDMLKYKLSTGKHGWSIEFVEQADDSQPNGIFDEIYYEGDEGMHGPFSAKTVYEWYIEDHLPGELDVFCGNEMVPHTLQDIVYDVAIIAHLETLCEDLQSMEVKYSNECDPNSWSFDIFSFPAEAAEHLIPICTYIFASMRLPIYFKLSTVSFVGFVEDVCERMSLYSADIVRYHNFWHAVDVMHCFYIFCRNFDAAYILTPLEITSLLFACLCHDLEHPGLGNSYQVNAQTDLAIFYNDCSVLENHHAAVGSALLKHHCVWDELDLRDRKSARNIFVSSILATDMSFHMTLTEDFGNVINNNFHRIRRLQEKGRIDLLVDLLKKNDTRSDRGLMPSDFKMRPGHELGTTIPHPERMIIMKTLLHAADINNCCKPFALSKVWSDRLVGEFFEQGDREKQENLPVSANMDRNTTNQNELSVNFIDFIVAPLFSKMSRMLPKAKITLQLLSDNRSEWMNRIYKDLEAEKQSPGSSKLNCVENAEERWKSKQENFTQLINGVLNDPTCVVEESDDDHQETE